MNEDYGPRLRPWIGWVLAGLVVLLALAGWLIVRGIGAANDLTAASRATTQLRTAITAGTERQFDLFATRIRDRAASAHRLTDDPIWRAAEHLPWAGEGLRALSSLAEASDILAQEALPLLIESSADLDLGTLGFTPGTPEPDAGHTHVALPDDPDLTLRLDRAATAAERAGTLVRAIDPDAVTGPARDAVADAYDAVVDAQRSILALRAAVRLMPAMVGQGETRHWLIAVHNGADVRAGGGVIETVVQVDATGGALTVALIATTRALPAAAVPVPEHLTGWLEESTPLHELARVPSFPDAAPLIAAHWAAHYGVEADGVIAVDTDVLRSVLAATGPIGFSGYTADSGEIIDLVTVTIPRAQSDPAAQAALFTDAVKAAVNAALGRADPAVLVDRLRKASDAGHLRIWSAHPDEQAVLAASDLSGAVPPVDAAGATVGFLIDDTTGGRMNAYTSAAAALAVGICDGTPLTRVTMTWTNDVELDAEAPLPAVVTGPATEDFAAGGLVRTRLGVYGPAGSVVHGGTDDGALGAHPIVWHEVEVAPGRSASVSVTFAGDGAGERIDRMLHTPLLGGVDITRVPLECD